MSNLTYIEKLQNIGLSIIEEFTGSVKNINYQILFLIFFYHLLFNRLLIYDNILFSYS
jgi:hypothetical protein